MRCIRHQATIATRVCVARQASSAYPACHPDTCEQGRTVMENTKVCNICHQPKLLEEFGTDNSTPDGKMRYCKTCIHERQNERRRRQKFQQQHQAQQKQPVKPPKSSDKNTLTLDFGDYPELRDTVTALAKKEFRTPEQQILYLLAQGMTQ